jgi:hypothetical protein
MTRPRPRTRTVRRRTEAWYSKSWRPAAAYVYLAICVCDFIVMPMYYEYTNHMTHSQQFVGMALKFSEPASQIEALRLLGESRSWEPITLKSTGLLHMAFGAILGVAAWTRGQEKVESIRSASATGTSDE